MFFQYKLTHLGNWNGTKMDHYNMYIYHKFTSIDSTNVHKTSFVSTDVHKTCFDGKNVHKTSYDSTNVHKTSYDSTNVHKTSLNSTNVHKSVLTPLKNPAQRAGGTKPEAGQIFEGVWKELQKKFRGCKVHVVWF